MPRHDHYCRECEAEFEAATAEAVACPRCGSSATNWRPKLGGTTPFAAFWHPHLGQDPVYIDSARTLDRELTTRGLHIREGPRREPYRRLPQSEAEARHRT